jgi:hypothetical protein
MFIVLETLFSISLILMYQNYKNVIETKKMFTRHQI